MPKKKKTMKKQRSVWQSALLALPVTLAVSMLLLCLLGGVLLMTDDPIRYADAAGLIALYLGALIGGQIVARLCGRRFPLLGGLLVGAGLFVLLTVPSLFFSRGAGKLVGYAFLLRLPILPLTLAGAFLACRPKKVKHRR